ncbi:hypothetical protein [Pedobacter cryoconitis]|uniref:Uncharacterized protein n=1 Tax=Pedobacter cryoconitis TaxID=188932 RepID=A0A327SGA7_9SPHI|nr:hypothetical protein [Pedobacter cryoconitis]RAJ28140.1 hypothetical protein LY11_03460 [Pedobacter cryoconitis]
MFSILLVCHSILRWLVLISLSFTIYSAAASLLTKSPFTKKDDQYRHWTATIVHVQFMLGMAMYFKSAAVARFHLIGIATARGITEPTFFGILHISMMITAVILITLGSAFAKRYEDDTKKFSTLLLCFGIALLIILAAIPWPFSPLAQRPLLRPL